MTLDALGNVGEFVSGIVVVVSLVYLALQLRQNTAAIRNENYGRALDRLAAQQARMAGEAEVMAIFQRGLADPAALTPDERARFVFMLYELLGSFEFMFHQAESRSLAREVWERWAAALAWWLSFPGVRAAWRGRPVPFSRSFEGYVADVLAKHPQGIQNSPESREFLRRGRIPETQSA